MQRKLELKDKFIGFVDILGYSALTKAAEEGRGLTLEDLEKILTLLGSDENRTHYEQNGPTICPQAPRIEKHLDFQVTQVWDSVVISAEVSPAGVISLVSHCFGACFRLLRQGVMCRGYIKRGKIHHEGIRVFGSGHVDAVEKERQVSFYKQDADERGTPFIEVDPEVVSYVQTQQDKCVKDVFSRMVVTHQGLTAIFPIRNLGHSFMIAGFGMPPFDPAKERKSNDNMRKSIVGLKVKVLQHVEGAERGAVKKSEHYIRALDEQLRRCDVTDGMIDTLEGPFGARATKDKLPGLFRDE